MLRRPMRLRASRLHARPHALGVLAGRSTRTSFFDWLDRLLTLRAPMVLNRRIKECPPFRCELLKPRLRTLPALGGRLPGHFAESSASSAQEHFDSMCVEDTTGFHQTIMAWAGGKSALHGEPAIVKVFEVTSCDRASCCCETIEGGRRRAGFGHCSIPLALSSSYPRSRAASKPITMV